MNIKHFLKKDTNRKMFWVVLLLIVAILSMTVISRFATSPESYKATIHSIDEKKATVMGVTATAAVTSTALASIPGDVTTPIANEIMEISSYLLIVVCALVLEKSLLTVMGFLSFNILIPISCALLGTYVFVKKKTLKILAFKFIVFALVIVSIIPFSMKISDMIYEANKTTVEQITSELQDNVEDGKENEEKSWLDKILDKIKKSVSNVGEKAKDVLNSFIDAIALFIITYCALPIIIVFIVVWFINFLFRLNIPTPNINLKRLVAWRKPNENEESKENKLI